MTKTPQAGSPDRVALLTWVASMGAVTAEALAQRLDITAASARARLSAATSDRLLVRRQLLARHPALYTITTSGLRAAAVTGIRPCRVSGANSQHLIACVQAAAALERVYPDQIVQGERELRRDERQLGVVLASARLGRATDDGALHRPDLVLWSNRAADDLPLAIEVELTIKAPRRLQEICRAWARCRCVAGVLYLAAPSVESALRRALQQAQAGERVVVVPLDSLSQSAGPAEPPAIAKAVPSNA